MHRISTPEAIDGYWKALDAWRIASRQKDALSAKIPEDIKRFPRIQHGYFAKGGEQISLYAYSEWEIRRVIAQRKEIWAHMAYDQKRFRARLASYARKLKRGLEADRRALLAAQTEAGWAQAVESERTCYNRVYLALEKVRYSHIGSSHEALALIELVAKITDHARRTKKKNTPLGLSENMTTALLRKAGAYLSVEAQDSLKEAA